MTPTMPSMPSMSPFWGYAPYYYPPPYPPSDPRFSASSMQGNGGPNMSAPPTTTPLPTAFASPSSPPIAPSLTTISQAELHMLSNGIDDVKRTMANMNNDLTSVRIGMESMKGTIMPRAEITAELDHRVHEDVFKTFKDQVTNDIQTIRSGPQRLLAYASFAISGLMALIYIVNLIVASHPIK